MNDEFTKHVLAWGKTGKVWLDQLPQIIKTYEQKWQFEAFPPYELTYNYVAPVVLTDNNKAVLKIGIPQDTYFRLEIDALKEFNGEGSVKIIKSDPVNSVMLLEQADPGTPLSSVEDDKKATKILASVMKKLWEPLSNNHRFQTMQEWTMALNEYPKGNLKTIPMELVEKAKKLFDELINTSQSSVLCHGDLHHDNVLSSHRDQWLAIDPKGVIAEPEFETAALIRNPYKKISTMNNIENILKERIMILASELNFNPKRIHKWCLAQTILSGVWTSEDAGDTSHALKVAQVLDRIKLN